MALDYQELMHGVRWLADSEGYMAGWPSFAFDSSVSPTVWGAYCVQPAAWGHAQFVSTAEMPAINTNLGPDQVGPLVWAGGRWARSVGYQAAIPDFRDYPANPPLLGMFVFHSNSPLVFTDIPTAQLNGFSPVQDFGRCADAGATWNAVNLWAYNNGYPAGFPTFEHADYGAGPVIGAALVQDFPGLEFKNYTEPAIEQAGHIIVQPSP